MQGVRPCLIGKLGPPSSQENEYYCHPSITKIKRKQFLKKSKSKIKGNSFLRPLGEQSTNIPTFSIDLTRREPRERSFEPIEKCRNELSLQKKMLIKELEEKEEKILKLKETYQRIQSTKNL
jgi:hypothetical protein